MQGTEIPFAPQAAFFCIRCPNNVSIILVSNCTGVKPYSPIKSPTIAWKQPHWQREYFCHFQRDGENICSKKSLILTVLLTLLCDWGKFVITLYLINFHHLMRWFSQQKEHWLKEKTPPFDVLTRTFGKMNHMLVSRIWEKAAGKRGYCLCPRRKNSHDRRLWR